MKPLDISVTDLREMLFGPRHVAERLCLTFDCDLDANATPQSNQVLTFDEAVQRGINCPFDGEIEDIFFIRSDWGFAEIGFLDRDETYTRLIYRAVTSDKNKGFGIQGGWKKAAKLTAEQAPLHLRLADRRLLWFGNEDRTEGQWRWVISFDTVKASAGREETAVTA